LFPYLLEVSKMKTLSKRLDSHFVACAVAAATAVVGSADAAIQMFTYGPTGIQVPADIDGIYFNLTTGATGTSAAAVGGGPFMNPYGTSTTNMSWYAPAWALWSAAASRIRAPWKRRGSTPVVEPATLTVFSATSA
jgi:hypothetical protein